MRGWSVAARPLAFAAALLGAAPTQAAVVSHPVLPTAAAPVARPTPEAGRLSVEVARRMFGRVDWEALLKRQGAFESVGKQFDEQTVRPQWGEFARQALAEEFASGAPDLDEALGRVIAQHFTLDELRAGAEMLRGPAGDGLAQAVADATAGREITPMSTAAKAAMRAAVATPAGAAFIQKIGHLDTAIPAVDQVVGSAVALGWIRRFYAKAAAAEAPPAAPTDERERLAGELTRLMFQSVDFGRLIQSKLGPELEQSFDFAPGWADLMRSSVTEEFGADRDTLKRAGGKVFARYFTVEELRAGVAVLSGPDGAVFAQAIAAGANGGSAPPREALNRATMDLQRTPAGLAFMKRMQASVETGSRETGEEYGAVVMLGVLRRFIEKAETAQPSG